MPRDDPKSGSWLPSRIGDLLPDALERMGPSGVWTDVRVRRVWERAVGETVASHAKVLRLRKGTLEVGVTEDTWATELRYLGAVIASKLNELLGEDLVREIAVRRLRRDRR